MPRAGRMGLLSRSLIVKATAGLAVAVGVAAAVALGTSRSNQGVDTAEFNGETINATAPAFAEKHATVQGAPAPRFTAPLPKVESVPTPPVPVVNNKVFSTTAEAQTFLGFHVLEIQNLPPDWTLTQIVLTL